MEIKCRKAPSIGELEGEPQEVWGTEEYEFDINDPTVFFGLYGLNDFYQLWRHKGKKWILWAGSDILHFQKGYWLDDKGDIKINPEALAEWINKNCESWVENELEKKALEDLGIKAKVCPSFMGNIEDYDISFTANERPKVYLSVSGNNFEMYGWHIVEEIADKCDVDFYLYGNTEEWETKHHNVFVRGRIPKEQMNEEIKEMQCGLRLCEFDGFSEILAKSILWGQYPITWAYYEYPFIDSFRNKEELVKILNNLKTKTNPNPARDYYKQILNQYPWKK